MSKLKMTSYILAPCLGCGHKAIMCFSPPVFVISVPEIVCSEECANRHEAHLISWLERNSNGEQIESD